MEYGASAKFISRLSRDTVYIQFTGVKFWQLHWKQELRKSWQVIVILISAGAGGNFPSLHGDTETAANVCGQYPDI